jgi:peroxiredoxin
VKGDASHLRETEVTGTEDNEQLTQFRLKANDMTPPEVMKSVYTFVKDHPRSPASRYLMNKHFLLKPDPDYKQALQLVGLMIDADPKNDELYQLKNQLTVLKDVFSDKKLPKFSAVTIDGKKVSEADLKAEVNVVLIWASWNFDTLTMQRQLKKQKNTYGSRLSVVGISLDGSLKECKDAMKRDSISWPTVCDGRLWQSPVIQALGVYDIPSNFIVTSSGKILATNLGVTDLRNKVDELLKVHTQ